VAISLTPEKLLKIRDEVVAWGEERLAGGVLTDHQAAQQIAEESEFRELLERIKNNPDITLPAIDDAQLAIAIAVASLRPQDKKSSVSQAGEIFADFQKAYLVVENEVLNKEFSDQVLLCRDVVIAWGNGWHRADFDKQSDGPGGRWIRALLAFTYLMDRAVEHTLKLLSNNVDKLFTPRVADPESPGNINTIASYAAMLAASAAADCCDCGFNKCHTRHHLSRWSPQASNDRAFPLRAFAAQMSRGDAGPGFHNKEFQNSALYPLLRDFHGLDFHDRAEFKECHDCGRKYEGNQCQCGAPDDPLITKHIVFENAFFVKNHKLYVLRRKQRCRRCKNLYSLKDFKACPLCGEPRTPNRDTKVHVLNQRLDSRAVLQPDYSADDSNLEEIDDVLDVDKATVINIDTHLHVDQVNDLVEQLVANARTLRILTDSEATEIVRRAQSGELAFAELRNLNVRIALRRLYEEAGKLTDIAPALVARIEDLVFETNRTDEEFESDIVTAKAEFLAKKGLLSGVMTPSTEEQFLTSYSQFRNLDEALERWNGLEYVIDVAQLVSQARNAALLSGPHAKQCMNQALGRYGSLDEIEDNSRRISAYLLANLGNRLGVIEEAVSWSILDAADNDAIDNQTLSELKRKTEAMLKDHVPGMKS
jgi:hypothetical protein